MYYSGCEDECNKAFDVILSHSNPSKGDEYDYVKKFKKIMDDTMNIINNGGIDDELLQKYGLVEERDSPPLHFLVASFDNGVFTLLHQLFVIEDVSE